MRTVFGYCLCVPVILGVTAFGVGCDKGAPEPVPDDPVTVAPNSTEEQPQTSENSVGDLGDFQVDPLPPPGASARR